MYFPIVPVSTLRRGNLWVWGRDQLLYCAYYCCTQYTDSYLHVIIIYYRERLGVPLSEDTTMFFLVNDKSLVVLSTPMRQVYDNDKDEDGFLYVVYTSQPGMG